MKNINRGFTLIELMIVIAIVGILAAVGYPAYANYVKKAQRADAIHALLVESGRMEEFYLNSSTYVGAAVASADSPEGHYKIALTAAKTTAFAYELTATRSPANDAPCKVFTYDQLGTKDNTGSEGSDCWR